MKILILPLCFFVTGFTIDAQNFSKVYDLSMGSEIIDNGRSVTRDFEVIDDAIFVHINHLCDADPTDNIREHCTGVYKFSKDGELINNIMFDSLFPLGNNRMAIHDNYLLVSGHKLDTHDTSFVLVEKLDFDLNILSDHIVGTNLQKSIFNNGIISDGDYIYTYGRNFKDEHADESHIQKINSDYELVDEFRFSKGLSYNNCLDLQPTVDGNLIYINDWSDGVGAQPNGSQIMVIDTDGNPLDSLNIKDNHPYTDVGRAFLSSYIGDVYLFSSRDLSDENLPTNGSIYKYDKDLDTFIWRTELPFNNFTNARQYEALNMIEAQNGDILVCGTVFDEGPDGPIANGYDHTWNGFITRLDSDGNILWLRLYKTDNNYPLVPKSDYGRYLNSTIWNIHELEDGRIVTGGTSYHTGWQNDIIRPAGETEFYAWLMTVNADGCLDGEECDEVIILDGEYRPKDGYLPIITSEQTWVYQKGQAGPPESFQFTYSEDSLLIDTNIYYERIQSNNEDGSDPYIQGYYRELEGKVYQKFEGNFNEEVILDMSLIVGDTFAISDPFIENHLVVVNIDTVSYLDNIPRKRIELQCAENPDWSGMFWIEGIGELYSGAYCAIDGLDTQLRCVLDMDGQRIYSTIDQDVNCWLTTTTDDKVFKEFSIYPNPVTNTLEIVSEKQIDKAEIYTINGIKVNTLKNVNSIDLTDFYSGIYYLKVFTDQGVGIQSFVKH